MPLSALVRRPSLCAERRKMGRPARRGDRARRVARRRAEAGMGRRAGAVQRPAAQLYESAEGRRRVLGPRSVPAARNARRPEGPRRARRRTRELDPGDADTDRVITRPVAGKQVTARDRNLENASGERVQDAPACGRDTQRRPRDGPANGRTCRGRAGGLGNGGERMLRPAGPGC